MHALARLIEDVIAANPGMSQSDIARASGGAFNRQSVSNMVKQPVKRMPSVETIVGLSRALRVPEWVVVDAYLESLQLSRRPNRLNIDEAIDADAGLSVEDKNALHAFVAHLRASKGPTIGPRSLAPYVAPSQAPAPDYGQQQPEREPHSADQGDGDRA